LSLLFNHHYFFYTFLFTRAYSITYKNAKEVPSIFFYTVKADVMLSPRKANDHLFTNDILLHYNTKENPISTSRLRGCRQKEWSF